MNDAPPPAGFLGNVEILERLKRCNSLPTPPGVAARIIEMSNDPDVQLAEVAQVVSLDPALTAKILRMANSALYARRRKVENLRQAIVLFGLNGTLTIALSFSLAIALRKHTNGGGLDYGYFWQRAVTTATSCRMLGQRLGRSRGQEDLFLAGLLQDIGMLALGQAAPEVYRGAQLAWADHTAVRAAEVQALGADHAAVGAWLLEGWNLPKRFQYAVLGSHEPELASVDGRYRELARCAAQASDLAEVLSANDHDRAVAQVAESLGGIDPQEAEALLRSLAAELQDTARLLDVEMSDPTIMRSLLGQAKEVLLLRNLQGIQDTRVLRKTARSLERRTRELEEETRRDGLTRVFNRAHLDRVFGEEFSSAKKAGWDLSVVFVDLDDFKDVNDLYGHHVGDEILKSGARILTASTRNTDMVVRYGGDEFVLLLPGTGVEAARLVGERVVQRFRGLRVLVEDGSSVTQTVSAGAATLSPDTDFVSPAELLQAADRAAYAAKTAGKNRFVLYAAAP
jgi:diguanylate cyclase (GGDEF)-like protein